MRKLLITYYSKTNTTKEICEYMSQKLSESNNEITVLPIDQVNELNTYDTVIIGGPINGMRWAEPVQKFTENNAEILKNKQVSLFYVSYLLDNGYKLWQKTIKKSLNKYKALMNPIAIGEFYGRVEKSFTGVPKLLFGSSKDAPLDRRDWSKIDAFIEQVK
jgi:menaquinone-dependent protoporphyrinogen oxidase